MDGIHNSRIAFGVEVELNLIDKNGYIANTADDILKDRRNDGSFVEESCYSQIEVQSLPFATVSELEQDLLSKLELLEEICEEYGVSPVPVSEFGAGMSRERERKSAKMWDRVLGKDESTIIDTISGVHCHIDQVPGRLLEQFWILCALDPVSYALTSTSPIRYDGLHEKNCHRVNLLRNEIMQKYRLHRDNLPYPSSVEEIDWIIERQFRIWLDDSGMDYDSFTQILSKDIANFSPVRKRDGIGPYGTFEVRGFDTCPVDILLGALALYKGVLDHVISKSIPVSISGKGGHYEFGRGHVVLPTYIQLKNMEREAIQNGLKPCCVSTYIAEVLEFAEEGLCVKDKPLIEPVKNALSTRKNCADLIISHLRGCGYSGSNFTSEQAAVANLFMLELYLKGLMQCLKENRDLVNVGD